MGLRAASSQRSVLLLLVLAAALVALMPAVSAGALELDGLVLESFDPGPAGWTNFQGTGTLADDTVNVLDGSHSLKLTTPVVGGAVGAQKLLPLPVDLSADQQIRVYFYVWEDDPGTSLTQCDVRLATTPDFANAFNATPALARVHKGWNVLLLNHSDFTSMGAPTWASPIVGVKLKVASAQGPLSVSFDSIWTGVAGQAAVSFVFDDGWSSVYTEAFGYMRSKGMPGSVAVVPTLVGEPQRCSLSQLEEMYASGWDMLNHTYDHADLTSLTDAHISAEVRDTAAYLEQSGMARGAYDLAYPAGQFDQRVVGAARAGGMSSGMSTNALYESTPVVDSSALKRAFLYHTTTLAEAKSWVDGARSRGAWVVISAHALVDGTPGVNQWRASDFRELVDYIAASGVPVVPYTDAFARSAQELRYAAAAGGRVEGRAGQMVEPGSVGTTVTAVPDAGMRFLGWSDGAASAERRDVSAAGGLSVVAEFAGSEVVLAYAAGSGGSISGDAVQILQPGASGTTVTAVPEPGHHFTGWSDGVTGAERRDTGVQADVSVTALFERDVIPLHYVAGPGGSLAGSAEQSVPYGEPALPVTAVPNTGYHFVGWSDGVGTASRHDAYVTGPIDVTASFAVDTFRIVGEAGPNGSVSVSSGTVTYGGSATVTITPNAGYRIADVVVDGVSVGVPGVYGFTNVTSDHRVAATFIALDVPVRYEQGDARLAYTGKWTTQLKPVYSGGSCAIAAKAGCAVTVRFRGTGISWVTSVDRRNGIARVTLDKGTPVDVDLYAATHADRVSVWSARGLADGIHTLRIEYTGRKNRASGGTNIGVDALDVIGVLTQGTG